MPCSVLTVLHCISNCKATAEDLATAVTACCIAASRLQAAYSHLTSEPALLQKSSRLVSRGNPLATQLQAGCMLQVTAEVSPLAAGAAAPCYSSTQLLQCPTRVT